MKPQVITLRTDRDAQRLHTLLKLNWRAMAAQGEPLDVIVQTHKAKHTRQQENYYWNFLRCEVAPNAWVRGKQYSAEVWDEQFKKMFVGVEDTPDGSGRGMSKSGLGVQGYNEYIEKCIQYYVEDLGGEMTTLSR